MHIDGIAIKGYRSFAGELQKIGPFKKINIFVGQNNSGKSNILTFLSKHWSTVVGNAQNHSGNNSFNDLDVPRGIGDSGVSIGFGLNLDGKRYRAERKRYIEACKLDTTYEKEIDKILMSQAMSQGTRCAWFVYKAANLGNPLVFDTEITKKLVEEKVLSRNEWNLLWNRMTGRSGGALEQHWIPEVLASLSPVHWTPPKVDMIEAVRSIGPKGSASEGFSGVGIIDRLARLQNPDINSQQLKKRFTQINEFLKTVTGISSAEIEIPYERDVIQVHADGKILPLSSLGTGIHEVVILGAAATILENQIVCIEEPELHLHPLLQKKLLEYLAEETSNQYMITTHSANILDTPNAAVFHVKHDKNSSHVSESITDVQRSGICVDLGYRASDIIQSNAIIWVEGPSDRILIRHWLNALAPELIEGQHYSIMFYGGRLLSHLSANDPELEEFISLRRLNRNISIVIDSDRKSRKSAINATKERIIAEFTKSEGGVAWVTEGREIENYIHPSILLESMKEICSSMNRLKKSNRYSHVYHWIGDNGKACEDVDKIKLAHAVAKREAELDVLDLRDWVAKLAKFVQEANGVALPVTIHGDVTKKAAAVTGNV